MAKKETERVLIVRPTIVDGKAVIPKAEKEGGPVKPVEVEVDVRDAILLEASKKCTRPHKPQEEGGQTTGNSPAAKRSA